MQVHMQQKKASQVGRFWRHRFPKFPLLRIFPTSFVIRHNRYGLRNFMSHPRYDLVVIGSGPAGQKAALSAAKLGKRVAVVERTQSVGGVCIHTGTIPSKAMREAVLHLTGLRERSLYGDSYAVKQHI